MDNIQKYSDLKMLNYSDVSFLLGISTSESKEMFVPETQCLAYIKGLYKITNKDYLPIGDFEVKIKSCTELESKKLIKTVVDTYNKSCGKSRLLKYSETKSFVKALRFTGNHTILNKILNKLELKLLQEKWLLKNILYKKTFSKNTKEFIKNISWFMDFIEKNNLDINDINQKLNEDSKTLESF